jgi:ferrochelatase
VFHDHPRFVAVLVARLREVLATLPAERAARARLVFSAHSVPLSMASTSAYESQLRETAGLVARELGRDEWTLCFQSRSGPPAQPWLEPDVNDHLKALAAQGATDVVLSPIGFVSDHMEVVYDLDTQARATAHELGIDLRRAVTPGVHPAFVALIVELIQERVSGAPRRALGSGPRPDVCALDCCPAPAHGGRPRPGA